MIVLFGATLLAALAMAEQSTPKISEAKPDRNGFLVHTIESPYQAGPTEIKVLLPDRLEPGKRYPVVYVLPVEAHSESRYGDGFFGGEETRPPEQAPGHLR